MKLHLQGRGSASTPLDVLCTTKMRQAALAMRRANGVPVASAATEHAPNLLDAHASATTRPNARMDGTVQAGQRLIACLPLKRNVTFSLRPTAKRFGAACGTVLLGRALGRRPCQAPAQLNQICVRNITTIRSTVKRPRTPVSGPGSRSLARVFAALLLMSLSTAPPLLAAERTQNRQRASLTWDQLATIANGTPRQA